VADRTIDVVSFEKPWLAVVPHAKIGNLDGILDIVDDEWGLAAGTDLTDETTANAVFSSETFRIQFRGAAQGCLTFDSNSDTGISSQYDDSLKIAVGGITKALFEPDAIGFYVSEGFLQMSFSLEGSSYDASPDILFPSWGTIAVGQSFGICIDKESIYNSPYPAYVPRFSIYTNGVNHAASRELFRFTKHPQFSLSDDAVLHTMTDEIRATAYGALDMVSTVAGGLRIRGWKDSTGTAGEAITMRGALGEAPDTSKGAGSIGVIHIEAAKAVSPATESTTVGADGNLMTIANHTVTRFIFDAEGEMHSDAVIGVGDDWDEWDDLALAADLSRLPKARWSEMMRYKAEDFERAGLVTLSTGEDGVKHAFVKHKAMLQFYACCFREVAKRFARYDQAFAALGVDSALLEAQ